LISDPTSETAGARVIDY